MMDVMAMNETQRLHPGPTPEGETPVTDNPPFVNACTTLASSQAASFGLRFGKSILTHSDVWGFIWRIDFLVKEQRPDSKQVCRLVCWSAEDNNEIMGTATFVAQPLEPL
jgi:hypothetical protein